MLDRISLLQQVWESFVCDEVSSDSSALVVGAAPAVMTSITARNGVAAHFKAIELCPLVAGFECTGSWV